MAHRKLDILDEKGYVILEPHQGELDPAEWEQLTYIDWKSGGDTNFAVLASATGEDDARGVAPRSAPARRPARRRRHDDVSRREIGPLRTRPP